MAKYLLDYHTNQASKKAKPATKAGDPYLNDEQESEDVSVEIVPLGKDESNHSSNNHFDEVAETDENLIGFHEKDDSDDSIRYYLEEIARYKLLTADEEKELSKRIQSGDKKALDHLIKSNLRLVVKIAKQYISNEYPLIDIIQDGNLGLIRACEKFDYKKNVRFSTYASWWIKQTIVRSLSIRKRMIRIPHRKEEKFRKIKKTMDVYFQKFQVQPTDDELSELTQIPIDEIHDIKTSMVNVVSYENTFVDDDNCTILDMLSDNKEKPDEIIFTDQLKAETRELLDSLQPKEREVIIRRFGFDSSERSTLKAMGNSLGISAETIRQIEIKALRKLRIGNKHLREYLN